MKKQESIKGIIQICTQLTEGGSNVVTALCEDGTVWVNNPRKESNIWNQIN